MVLKISRAGRRNLTLKIIPRLLKFEPIDFLFENVNHFKKKSFSIIFIRIKVISIHFTKFR